MQKQPESTDPTEFVIRWGLVAFAGLAACGAVLRVFAQSPLSLPERIDHTTLLYLGVAAGLLLLRQVKSFSLGQLKFELIEKLREQQQRQEEKIADIALILPLLLPEMEVRHLLNLYSGQTEGYQGRSSLREELRRLRSIGLIAKKTGRNIGDIWDGLTIDLAEYVELTKLGRRWATRIQEIQFGDARVAGGPEAGAFR